MKKEKKFLTFEKPEISFKELDIPYQNHFIKEYILAAGLFIIAVILCVLIKEYLYILGCFIGLAAYGLYLYWQIYKSLTNKVVVIDGKCTDVQKKENGLLKSTMFSSKTAKITIKTENGILITQDVPYSSAYKTGETVRIYANEGTLNQLNANTYTVINPIFMHVLAS